jgi:hypothetical protein
VGWRGVNVLNFNVGCADFEAPLGHRPSEMRLSWSFSGSLNAYTVFRVGHNFFLPNPVQFLIHQLPYCAILVDILTEWMICDVSGIVWAAVTSYIWNFVYRHIPVFILWVRCIHTIMPFGLAIIGGTCFSAGPLWRCKFRVLTWPPIFWGQKRMHTAHGCLLSQDRVHMLTILLLLCRGVLFCTPV